MDDIRKSGFTLVELMIVVGLVGVVLLGSMRLFTDVFRTANQAEASQDLMMLTDNLGVVLSDQALCTAFLQGVPNAENEKLLLGGKYLPGERFGKIEIEMIRLQKPTLISGMTYLGEVGLITRAVGSGSTYLRVIPVVYKVDEANRIDRCYSDQLSTKGTCASLGGTWDSIKRECNFCRTMGGVWDGQGQCRLDTKNRSACPVQKIFSANGTGDTCSGWDADVVGASLGHLRSYKFLGVEVADQYRNDFLDLLKEQPKDGELAKVLGQEGLASWVMTMTSSAAGSSVPCQIQVLINVDCQN